MQRLVLTGPLVRVMTCGDSARARWAPWLPAHDTPRHDLPGLPARADVDPVLADVPPGGRLAVAGDDHTCKSSSIPHQSDHAFISAIMPVLYPSSVHEFLGLGLLGIAMSRFSGCWVGFKVIS